MTKSSGESRESLDERLKHKTKVDPSGHGEQSTPGQQRDIAESAEHDDDTARAVIDQKTLRDLKD